MGFSDYCQQGNDVAPRGGVPSPLHQYVDELAALEAAFRISFPNTPNAFTYKTCKYWSSRKGRRKPNGVESWSSELACRYKSCCCLSVLFAKVPWLKSGRRAVRWELLKYAQHFLTTSTGLTLTDKWNGNFKKTYKKSNPKFPGVWIEFGKLRKKTWGGETAGGQYRRKYLSNCFFSPFYFAFLIESWLVRVSFKTSPILILLSHPQTGVLFELWAMSECRSHGAISRWWWQIKLPLPSIRRHFIVEQLCRVTSCYLPP